MCLEKPWWQRGSAEPAGERGAAPGRAAPGLELGLQHSWPRAADGGQGDGLAVTPRDTTAYILCIQGIVFSGNLFSLEPSSSSPPKS